MRQEYHKVVKQILTHNKRVLNIKYIILIYILQYFEILTNITSIIE